MAAAEKTVLTLFEGAKVGEEMGPSERVRERDRECVRMRVCALCACVCVCARAFLSATLTPPALSHTFFPSLVRAPSVRQLQGRWWRRSQGPWPRQRWSCPALEWRVQPLRLLLQRVSGRKGGGR
jgi:hypothetical protein